MKDNVTKATRTIYLYETQDKKCYYCKRLLFENGAVIQYNIDHKTPSSKGGKDTLENVCLTCTDCNLLKGDLSEEEFKSALETFKSESPTKADLKDWMVYLSLKRKFAKYIK